MPRYLVITCLIAILIGIAAPVTAGPGRTEIELSGSEWRLWLDRSADWQEDTVFMPPLNPASLPVNPPTCGWDELPRMHDSLPVSVPGTVEQYHWGANGNPNGNSGDYRGVSWWSTTFTAPRELQGKRIELALASANLRAELYLNGRLVGYDVIGNTPFAFEVTDTIILGGENRLDIRITDPVGTFAWDDENMLKWGPNNVPSVHGFGGITGKVLLRATDALRITDVHARNNPDVRTADVFVTLTNDTGRNMEGRVSLDIQEWGNLESVLWDGAKQMTVPAGESVISFRIKAPKAKLWDIDAPNLYVAAAEFTSEESAITDTQSQRFGFRWFTVGEKNGDKRYYLNGRRVFLMAAMTRGFWPVNGMFATEEMAWRDMKIARELGFNMMLYHRAIGQPVSMDVADEMGVLTYEEPGGYLCNPMPDDTAKIWRREKLRRMVMRDRSRPSMVIYNMDDLSIKAPVADDIANITMMHELDPSRIKTYNCIIKPEVPKYREDDPEKLHMLPYDDTQYTHGWTCPYHLVRWPGWLDDYYENPRYYARYVLDPVADMGDSVNVMPEDEIIFYGEEGGLGTIMRLGKIVEELAVNGADGWRESEHLMWYDTIDRFLDDADIRSSYPTVDRLTTATAEIMYYFHGRNIENIRISNKADAYVINGWASAMTHTDIVDTYRNPVADTAVLKHYTQPLYVAVKLRDTVMPTGDSAIADIYLVNEADLRGRHTLNLTLTAPCGAVLFEDSRRVTIEGGGEFGQLLAEGITLPPLPNHGHYTLSAELLDRSGSVSASGHDEAFAVDLGTSEGFEGTVAVEDTSGVVQRFLRDAHGIRAVPYDPDGPPPDLIILGAHNPAKIRGQGIPVGTRSLFPLMEIVANGTRLIVLKNADWWADAVSDYYHKAVKYTGLTDYGNRGRMFVTRSPFLAGLPEAEAMNWEYQAFHRHSPVSALRLDPQGLDLIAGILPDRGDPIDTALCRVPFGSGELFLTTLSFMEELASDTPQAVTAQKLLLNLVEEGWE